MNRDEGKYHFHMFTTNFLKYPQRRNTTGNTKQCPAEDRPVVLEAAVSSSVQTSLKRTQITF